MSAMVARIGFVFAAVTFSIASITANGAGQEWQTSRLTGSSRVTGRVVAADDGKPVRRAEVLLSGHPDAEPDHMRLSRRSETDAQGRFDFADLPAGDYAIFFNRLTGFVSPKDYQQTRLAERQTADLSIRLQRTGAIEGRVLDQDGDPVLRAEVRAIDRVDVAGYFAWGTRYASAQTNDRGEFRIFNLPAGDYYLVASIAPSDHPHDPPPPSVGPVTTYYPGSTMQRDARAVSVRAGRDTEGLSFKLSRRNLATLSIAAVDSFGNPLDREGSVTLHRLDAPYASWSTRAARRENSEFIFRGVEPGDYSVVAWTRYGTGESAHLKVSIDRKDVSQKLQTNTGARVSGRVILDGQPAKGDPQLPNVWVSARKPSRTFGVSYVNEPLLRLQDTDRFELKGLRGPMELVADATYGRLISIRRGGEELSWKVIDFAGTEEIDNVIVELTTHVARLELTVPRQSADDSTEPLLFIFPEDRQRWRPGLAFQSSVLGGTAQFRLLPGRYFVVAINTAAVVDPADPALLDRLARLTTPINLIAGETTKLTVPLANAPR